MAKPLSAIFCQEPIDEEVVKVKTGNKEWGFYGSVYKVVGHHGDAARAFERMHGRVRRVTGEKDHLKVTHYLDSPHGRHLSGIKSNPKTVADGAVDAHIKKDFERFDKRYDPKFFARG